VNGLLLLLGLLVLSYIGSFLAAGRSLTGFGLPSGSEYLVLGFCVGPNVLGLVDRSMLASFDPIADVALGWLAMLLGLHYAFGGRHPIRTTSLIAASFIALLTAASVTAGELFAASRFGSGPPFDPWIWAAGVGIACAETTPHAVRWVIERKRAAGPLSRLLAELADSGGAVPILATAVLFLPMHEQHLPVAIPDLGWAGITLGLGILCGAVAAALLGREFRLHESFGVLLGTSLFGIGLAARLGLSVLALMFAMGLTLAAVSRHRNEMLAMVAPTERAILLPALVLAGARVEPRAAPGAVVVVVAALAARIVAKLISGWLLGAVFPAARRAGPLLGLGLLSTGALSVAIGLAFALRFPGPVGDTVLLAVAVTTIFGEFGGPARLGAALTRAGEITDASALAPDNASAAVTPP
jgi:Kef-type K+ transport system membrane component KefB